jgi:beta-N-acetylhexosaminidase
VPVDPEVRRQALSCLLLGFVGESPPRWLLDALDLGLCGAVLFGSNLGDGSRVQLLTDRLRSAAGRPLVLATDEEGGDVTRLDTLHGSAYIGAAALGHLDDVTATEETYAAIGTRLVEAGITMNLAPVADVNIDPLNPVIGLRSFGAEAELVARHVAAAVRGIQRTGVAACVKHFPGHGATRDDSHHEVAVLDRSREDIESVELTPFRAAVAAGARAVMTGHLFVPALDPDHLVTLSRKATTSLLRKRMAFTGTVVTDALEMRAVSATVGIVEGFVQALAAGADAIETGALDYPELVEDIPAAVQQALLDGRLSEERLAEASSRAQLLAEPGEVGEPFDPDVVTHAAGRSLEVVGVLPSLRRPLIVECRPPGGMASGELPWSLELSGAEVVRVFGGGEPLPDLGERSLVVLVRDPHRHPWQQPYVGLALNRPGSVIVDAGWRADLGQDIAIIRTRGIAPGLLAGVAELLAQHMESA